MKLLFFGDIYGRPGRTAFIRILPTLLAQHRPDFVIANVENIAHGRGATAQHLRALLAAGVDAFTSGNHIFDDMNGKKKLVVDENLPLVRPANYPSGAPGKSFLVLEKNNQKLFITNFLGRVFMGDPLDNPFASAEEILLAAQKLKVKHIFVDFHAEATSEKIMFGHHLAGRASAVVGTHTHVQTADARILSGGTAFISDTGFCGPLESVIGAKTEIARKRFVTGLPAKLEVAEQGPIVISGVAITLTEKSGRAEAIERIYEIA